VSTHPLTIFVYETFGQQFSDLLMVGYGAEPSSRPSRLYLSELEAGAETKWVIELVTRRSPCRDEPLVLIALLKLLLSRASISRHLEFGLSELLIELQWQDKVSTRQKVETTINGYIRLLYDKQADTRAVQNESAIAGGGYYHLLTGYIRGAKSGTLIRTLDSVCFDVAFIEGLRQGRVYFAGIDFGYLQTTG
jgi:hypothetical protein